MRFLKTGSAEADGKDSPLAGYYVVARKLATSLGRSISYHYNVRSFTSVRAELVQLALPQVHVGAGLFDGSLINGDILLPRFLSTP